jgi:hypothetical protein
MKYTKTIAVRVTQEEWELIEFAMIRDGLKNPTVFMRNVLTSEFRALRQSVIAAEKRKEAADRRAAKKATNDANA